MGARRVRRISDLFGFSLQSPDVDSCSLRHAEPICEWVDSSLRYMTVHSVQVRPFSGPSSAQPFKNWSERRYPIEAFFPNRVWDKGRSNSSSGLAATTHTRRAMAEEDLAQMRISVEMSCRDDFQSLQFRAVRSTRPPDLLWDQINFTSLQ
jgi:hypothetical protein